MPARDLPRGKVFLVGAGPGDAGLITWRGVECLRRADWVLYDYLVNPAILRHVSPDCRLVCLGGHRRSEVGSRKSEESGQAVSRRI
ncbi:MAG TPA: SAM-dependent methyltransferase, partial [Pirellulales bacterium]